MQVKIINALRRRDRPLRPYSRMSGNRMRYLYWGVAALLAILFGLTIGLLISLVPPQALYLPISLIIVLALVAIWAMPETDHGQHQIYQALVLMFILIFGVWPPYIALILPGMPWISLTRIVLFGALIAGLIIFSTSRPAKDWLKQNYQANKLLFICVIGLCVVQLLSLSMSVDPLASLKLWFRYSIYTLFVFLSVIVVVRKPRTFLIIFALIFFGALFHASYSPYEMAVERNLWLDYIPPGFGIDADFIEKISTASRRSATGEYRAAAGFVTPLEFAEYLAMAVPIALFLMVDRAGVFWRLVGALSLGLFVYAILLTGSRLGLVATIAAFFFYLFLWGVRRWQIHKKSLIGPAFTTLYPACMLTFAVLLFSSRTLYLRVIGGGEHQASNEARITQWQDGIPLVAKSPLFGYGLFQGAEELGYVGAGGTLTIDSFFLEVALDTGVPGFVLFTLMLFSGMYISGKAYVENRSAASIYGGLIASSIVAFFMAKLVLAQFSNHTIPYIMLALAAVIATMANRGNSTDG